MPQIKVHQNAAGCGALRVVAIPLRLPAGLRRTLSSNVRSRIVFSRASCIDSAPISLKHNFRLSCALGVQFSLAQLERAGERPGWEAALRHLVQGGSEPGGGVVAAFPALHDATDSARVAKSQRTVIIGPACREVLPEK